MYHAALNTVCLKTFSEKRTENELHRKYTLFGGPAGRFLGVLLPQFYRLNKFDDFI